MNNATLERELKLARCLAESLKRIQSLETKGGKIVEVITAGVTTAFQTTAGTIAEQGNATAARVDALEKTIPAQIESVHGFAQTLDSEMGEMKKLEQEMQERINKLEAQIPEFVALKEKDAEQFAAEFAKFKAEFAKPDSSAPKAFNPRGSYVFGEHYAPFDFVNSNGSSFIALVEDPTEPPTKKSRQWMLVAARGVGGGGISDVTELTGLGTGVATALGNATNASGGMITWASAPSLSGLTLTGSADVGSSALVRFGGTTSSFSALKISPFASSRLAVRLSDDSGYGHLDAATYEVFNGANRMLQFSSNTGGGISGFSMGSDCRITFTSVSSAGGDGGNGGNADTGITRISAGVIGIGNSGAASVTGAISLNEIRLSKTITAAGTTGAQTINKSTGSVNFAAAATSLVVTNSLVTTSSVIQCTVAANDTTMKSVAIVAAAGSFTIYPNAAPTAETRVNFTLTN